MYDKKNALLIYKIINHANIGNWEFANIKRWKFARILTIFLHLFETSTTHLGIGNVKNSSIGRFRWTY